MPDDPILEEPLRSFRKEIHVDEIESINSGGATILYQ